MMVKNREGGNGMVGLNELFAAKADGLTIGLCAYAQIVPPVLMKDAAVKYDLKKFNWMGYLCKDSYGLCMSPKKPYKTVEDIRKAKGLVFGAESPNASHALAEAVVIELLGLDAKLATGFTGSSELGLASGRGEIDGYVSTVSTMLDHIDKTFIQAPVLMVGTERSKSFPKATAITELIKMTSEQQKLFDAFYVLVGAGAGKVVFIPPAVPQDKLDFLVKAFDQIVANQAFQKQILLRNPVWEEPTNAADFKADINKALGLPSEVITTLSKLAAKNVR